MMASEPRQAHEQERRRGIVYRNIANAASLLGILPLPILLLEGGYKYVIPMMIYNGVMDDLDGILAAKLDIRSEFGCILDNVCDALAHTVFVMIIAMHHGAVCGAVSVVAMLAIQLRVVSRLHRGARPGVGSPTNELVRHMLFILLLAEIFAFDAVPFLMAAFVLNAISMVTPLAMPYLLRGMIRSTLSVAMMNLALLSAWLLPRSTTVIAACFFLTYLTSFGSGVIRWLRAPKRATALQENAP